MLKTLSLQIEGKTPQYKFQSKICIIVGSDVQLFLTANMSPFIIQGKIVILFFVSITDNTYPYTHRFWSSLKLLGII